MSLFLDSVSESRKIQIVTASGIGNRPVHVVGDNFYTINNFGYPVVSSNGGISWTGLTANPPLNLTFSSIGHSNLDIFFKRDASGSDNVFALSELSRAAALNVAPVKISDWSGNTFPQSAYSFRSFFSDGDYIGAKTFSTDNNLQRVFLFNQTQSASSALSSQVYSLDLDFDNVGLTKSLSASFDNNNKGFLTWALPAPNFSSFARLSQLTDGVERLIYPWTLCEAETRSSSERGLACVLASDQNGSNTGIYRIYKDNVAFSLTQAPRVEFIPVNFPFGFSPTNLSDGSASFKITDDGKIFVVYNLSISSSRWFSQNFGSDWTQLPSLTNANHSIVTPVENSVKISADGRNHIIRASNGTYISTNYGY